MKRLFLFSLLVTSLCAKAQIDKDIPPKPASSEGLVIDYTGKTLTPEQKEALNKKLVDYDDSTSNQVALVIVPTLKGYDVNDYAVALGRAWGVGGKEFNNGVVVLVSIGDRKIAIQVGYGLEGAIPDVTAKSIIDNDATPNFKNGDYYRGLDDATDDIIKAAAGRYTAPAGYNKKSKGFSIGGIILFIIILSIFLGSRGGNNGGMISRRGFGGFGTGWLLGSMMGGGWGRGGGGGGGGWSGGGGGFGGFGGGSFGGGGASGGW